MLTSDIWEKVILMLTPSSTFMVRQTSKFYYYKCNNSPKDMIILDALKLDTPHVLNHIFQNNVNFSINTLSSINFKIHDEIINYVCNNTNPDYLHKLIKKRNKNDILIFLKTYDNYFNMSYYDIAITIAKSCNFKQLVDGIEKIFNIGKFENLESIVKDPKSYYNKLDDGEKIIVILKLISSDKKYFETLQDNNLIKPAKLLSYITDNWYCKLYINKEPIKNWLTDIVKILCEYYPLFMKSKGIYNLAVKNNNTDLINWLHNNNFKPTRKS